MTSDEVKKTIADILEEKHSTQLYLVFKIKEEFVIKLADIEDEITAPELQKLFEDFLNATVISNEDMIVQNLSVADELSNAIYQYDYNSYPKELTFLKDFKIKEAVNTARFNFKLDDLSSLFGYIVYIGSMKEGMVLFKKHYPISLIKRDSFLLGRVKSKSRFEKISGEDIIRLNGDVHLLCVKDTIFVLDLKVLERNMGFTELIRKEATEAVKEIEKLDILDDIEVLSETLEDLTFTRKLSKIRNSSPLLKLKISKKAIVEFTKTTPALIGIFKYSEDGEKIRLDTKKSKKEFLKLMDDSYLYSELTQQYYEALAKDNLTKNSN